MKVKRINQLKDGTKMADALGEEEEKGAVSKDSDRPGKSDETSQNRIIGTKVRIGKNHLGKKTESRSVTIGGNASGNVIITDDGRTVKK